MGGGAIPGVQPQIVTQGGGIYVDSLPGSATISGSRILHNSASDQGGGIYSTYGQMTITGSTIDGNQSRSGGGIDHSGGTIVIDTLEGNLSTDEIIKMVVDKKIRYTVADRNLARINASSFPVLDVSVPVSFSQRIGWAVRKNAPMLQAALNHWILQEKKTPEFNYLYKKYFENPRSFNRRVRSEFYSLSRGQISPYDSLIKAHAADLGWDWRLLASQVYQESRFDAGATAWTGALGLMQLMPSTAAELGVSDPSLPAESLDGGVRYLKQLGRAFEHIPDTLQWTKFTLAAYNCGLGHVQDAQRLAELRGLDPNRWDQNVDQMILGLSYPKNYNEAVVQYGYLRGVEPYRYVRQVFERYAHYESLIPLSPGEPVEAMVSLK